MHPVIRKHCRENAIKIQTKCNYNTFIIRIDEETPNGCVRQCDLCLLGTCNESMPGDQEASMHRIRRIAPICVVLFLCAVHSANAQNNPKGPAMPAAKQNTFGLGSGGGPTPRRQAASQAATRAVACMQRPVGRWPDP